MYQVICDLLDSEDFQVVESFETRGRPERLSRVPRFLFESPLGNYLQSEYRNGLWKHQTEALESLGAAKNVVISTGTASGKSLVFRSLVLHKSIVDPTAKTVVFYPQKALIEDQMRGWLLMTRSLGLSDDIIGRIDGSVRLPLREEILRKSRIIVMTPDVCQAWMMSRLAMPSVRDFVGSLEVLVMDEAHELEGVFGSNFAFLVRRIVAARNEIMKSRGDRGELQLIAATATISDPSDHLQRLTGAKFVVVDHDADGAQSYDRRIAHVACSPGDHLTVARQLQQRVLTQSDDSAFITFVDSRKGVETLAIATEEDLEGLIDDPAVSAYRAGYTPDERRSIEHQLRSGALRGVVSTSALELGIDFPSLSVGFNLGLPPTRKAYRQRLGRVGRSDPGAFIVVGTPNEFRQYGTSLQEYHEMSVEPSYLYLNNRFMQFAHGRCLADEREALAAPSSLPSRVDWPSGFGDAYVAAGPTGNRAPEFDAIADLGGDSPHYGYPLRNVGERNFQIKIHDNADPLGDASQSQALRECYPGASYFHNMRPYYVAAWHTQTFHEPFIRVRNGMPRRTTRPRITTWLNASLTAGDVLDGHLVRGPRGFLAECQMMITERVEGYVDNRSGEYRSYQELQQQNSNMRSRSRNFRTSGVVLCIDAEWFQELPIKRQFADSLLSVFSHQFSISPRDLGSTSTNIVVHDVGGRRWRRGCVAIFDQTYGSLRFTEQLFRSFDAVLIRVALAMESECSADGRRLGATVSRVREEVENYASSSPLSVSVEGIAESYEMVFRPGSRVCHRESGSIFEDVTIVEPIMVPEIDDRLRYRVEVQQPFGPSSRRFVLATAVEPSAEADAWEYGWWNRETQTYEDPPDEAQDEVAVSS